MAQLNSTNITGNLSVTGTTVTSKIIKNDGTSDDILLGDGSVASLSQYAKTSDIPTSASDVDALPISGGTLTGNLSGKYITGTWLQTTSATDLGSAPPKYGVIDGSGWIYTRTLAETKSDLGVPTMTFENGVLKITT